MLEWKIKHFNELSTLEFHDLIALRIRVFIVEQNCPYLEIDGKDKKSYHVIARDGIGNLVATARIIPAGIAYSEIAVGRVVVDSNYRDKGYGHQLMKHVLQFVEAEFGAAPIRISAQSHLEKYYNAHGFESTGKAYLEDDIPHIEMLYKSHKI